MSSSSGDASPRSGTRRLRRIAIGIGVVALVLVALAYAGRAFVTIYSNALWFHSVHHESVYSRRLVTQVVLFAIFGGLTALVIPASLIAVARFRPNFRPHPSEQRLRYHVNRAGRLRWWLLAVVTLYLVVSVGSRAAGSWQTWLLWRNAVGSGQHDPQFHRDVSYYLFVYPMHRLALNLLFRILTTSIVVVVVASYLFGGWRLRGSGPRMTRAFKAQLSLLLGLYLVLKALAYWLDRFGLVTSNRGVVTGPSYTDLHAVLPDKAVLIVIAGLLALVLLGNVVVRSGRLLLLGVGGMAAAALVFGIVVPALVQQFKDKPSASTLEARSIARNLVATRAAFGLSDSVTTVPYAAVPAPAPATLPADTDKDAQVRLLDPNRLSPTFTQLQQQQAFYGFKNTLDVDRYPISGKQQDVLLAVRELQQSGLPSAQQTWTNTHLVYTHGYGLVAAPTNKARSNASPTFVQGGLSSTGGLGSFAPQIYYGQMSPSYSIVGGDASNPREFDHPATGGGGPAYTTHVGGGGISIGSHFRRLVFALKYGSPSILFSSEINHDSQLLSVRNPRSRVAAVAPWLTLDGDTYPVVSGGRILWVVDGYTTSNNYPNSQQQNLRNATATTLSQNGSTATQSNTSVNYIRNSVKATVDAYTGQVTLYEWNQTGSQRDPILATWEKAFPGLVKPQNDIPADLLPHLRYPQDLFNLQRTLLTQYHVDNAKDFYSGNDFWRVPTDPTLSSTTKKNSLGNTVTVSAPPQPSTYMTMSADGTAPAEFSLSSPLVTLNRRNLAAFLTVDAQPGPNYGHFTLLQLGSGSVEGPAQVQQDIEADTRVAKTLSLLRSGNSSVVLGNLLTIPVDGQVMYVEPIYTRSAGGTSFPVFQKVVVIYGDNPPSFAGSLHAALAGVASRATP